MLAQHVGVVPLEQARELGSTLVARPLLAGAEVLAGAVITAASDEEEKCLRTLSSLSLSALRDRERLGCARFCSAQ